MYVLRTVYCIIRKHLATGLTLTRETRHVMLIFCTKVEPPRSSRPVRAKISVALKQSNLQSLNIYKFGSVEANKQPLFFILFHFIQGAYS